MTRALLRHLARETDKLRQAGLFKPEMATEPETDADAIDFTSGDFLGLGRRPEVTAAASTAMQLQEKGIAAPRPFGGTRTLHQVLEYQLAELLRVPEALVYSSDYLANIGLFDAMFDARDYILADAAIHPSLAEGIRLCGARSLPYQSEDLETLEDRLKRSRTARFRVVVTDGVFPLSGNVAALGEICSLAERYDALVVVYDALGVGVLGEGQRGSAEHHGVSGRVDLITGSLVDVLGAAAGGYVAGRREIIAWLRQKSTPYLFCTALAPGDAGAAKAGLDLIRSGEAPATDLLARTRHFKATLEAKGLEVHGGAHAILTVVVGNVVALQRMVNALSEQRVHVLGMCFPVVPENSARIQLKVTAAHTPATLKTAAERLAHASKPMT